MRSRPRDESQRHVRLRLEHYAYRDGFAAAADESTPLWETGDPNATAITIEAYGPLKALCEKAVLECFDGRALMCGRD